MTNLFCPTAEYHHAIKKKHQPLDISIFGLNGRLSELLDVPDLLYTFNNSISYDLQKLKKVHDQISQFKSFKNVLQNFTTHPWNQSNITEDIDFTFENEINTNLKSYLGVLKLINDQKDKIRNFTCQEDILLPQMIERLSKIKKHIVNTQFPPLPWFKKEKAEEIYKIAQKRKKQFEVFFKYRDDIQLNFNEPVFNIDVDGYLKRLKNYKNKFILANLLNSEYRKDKKILKSLLKKKWIINDIIYDLERIQEYHNLNAELESTEEEDEKIFSDYYMKFNTNWDNIVSIVGWIYELNSKIDNVDEYPDFLKMISGQEKAVKTFSREYDSFIELYVNEIRLQNKIIEQLKIPLNSLLHKSISERKTLLESWRSSIDKLQEVSDINRILVSFKKLEIDRFVGEFQKEDLDLDLLDKVFEKLFYKSLIDELYRDNPPLRKFRTIQMEVDINRFRELDLKLKAESVKEIKNKLSQLRRDPNGRYAKTSEISILKREINKKRRLKPLRVLFKEIPNLLLDLKPCVMMSPLSVSQFISPDKITFDTVIFDEASQVCTEDAIGAILRAKQAIIVGDTKQLPPTAFFMASGGDDYEDEDERYSDVFESILSEASSTFGELMLKWHYRSRSEDLIAYSNYHFYENKLITFPNPSQDGRKGISYKFIEHGIYDRSKSRQNRVEACEIAKMVYDHFTNEKERSLGVIAFSEAQMRSIEEELEKLYRRDPLFEEYCVNDDLYGFFVKNIETVQGDERDVIFFSIGYGKDQNGKFNMNFGPLNKQGGKRRLNVAITRAKEKIVLVGSFQPHEIDERRTTSEGPLYLKKYIKYAQEGPATLFSARNIDKDAEFDSPFEEAVYEALTSRDLQLDKQVGCSGFRIDLAVVDPENHDNHLLGIECDGATYHSLKTVRDRDRLRQQILENQGWKIYRIWSTDWIRNRKRIIDEIMTIVDNPVAFFEKKNRKIRIDEEPEEGSANECKIPLATSVLPLDAEVYKKAPNMDIYLRDEFHNTEIQLIAQILSHIVNYEGPICIEEATRRLISYWGMNKIGSRIREITAKAILHSCKFHLIKITKEGFLWPNQRKEVKVRLPKRGERRNITHISKEEIELATVNIIRNCYSLKKDDLTFEILKLYGYNRSGKKAKERVENIVNKLIKFNVLKEFGKSITINTN